MHASWHLSYNHKSKAAQYSGTPDAITTCLVRRQEEGMRGKKRALLTTLLIAVLTMAMSVTVFAAVRIRFSGTQTMAASCSRRIYVEGAGSRKVSVTSSSKAVKIRKDSKSYIVTGAQAGSSYVTVKVGAIKKRIHTVVLSERQIMDRVGNKVKKYYSSASAFDSDRKGNTLKVYVSKPQGDGAPTMTVIVNLSTGRAVCEDCWDEFFRKVPKSFKIW